MVSKIGMKPRSSLNKILRASIDYLLSQPIPANLARPPYDPDKEAAAMGKILSDLNASRILDREFKLKALLTILAHSLSPEVQGRSLDDTERDFFDYVINNFQPHIDTVLRGSHEELITLL